LSILFSINAHVSSMQRIPNPANASLGAIVVTQIFVLLGTINQEKDKAKRDAQAEQINGVRTLSCPSSLSLTHSR
jgi:hypothetical protein